ncbi:MAG: chemotaxis protein CheB [Alphaproteobacteria bacterium]|nr:MAG: chemotaxis protein CheB [Alphaproteobacteria bacterium]
MANRDILAIGTSAGGVDALRHLAREFPADLPASVLVVIHLSNQFPSALDAILTQAGRLTATFASDGEALQKSHIYLAPPGRHLLLEGARLSLGSGARENHARPAIDPLFRSAALCCGPRSVGVVLTGTLGDGASGLMALQQSGGITVIQDPNDAVYPEMPITALTRVKPDHVASLAGMPALLKGLLDQPQGSRVPVPERIKYEVEVAKGGRGTMQQMDRIGRRSVLACPDCHGVMWEIDEGELIRYRCHVGHAYTAELMSVALDENLSQALGSALRALEERVALAERMRTQAIESGRDKLAKEWSDRVREFEHEQTIVLNSIRRVDEISAQLKRHCS